MQAEQLAAFSDSVRSKPEWFNKVLDPNRNLTAKWAIEAGILHEDPNKKIRGMNRSAVLGEIEELKQEARRIRFEDLLVHSGSVHAVRRNVDLQKIEVDVRKELNFIQNAEHSIMPVTLREDVGVFASNGLVPKSLHKELGTELDHLAEMEPKDFHPGTHGKVQDLIHPSLYPFVGGITQVAGETPYPDGFNTTMDNRGIKVELSSRFSWVPSTISVSADQRDARIESYINGLGSRDRYPLLYRLIELTFLMALPHLQKTLQSDYDPGEPPSVTRWSERKHFRNRGPLPQSEWNAFLSKQKKEKQKVQKALDQEQREIEKKADAERRNMKLFDDPPQTVSDTHHSGPVSGEKRYKVIVKAANYILRPGEVYEGSWHLEGMPHEMIVASAIYYWHADVGIADHGLSLQRSRISGDFPDPEEYHHRDGFSVSLLVDQKARGSKSKKKKKTDRYGESDSDGDEYVDPAVKKSAKGGAGPAPRPKLEEFIDYPSDWEDLAGPGATLDEFGGPVALGTVPTHEKMKYNGTGRIISFPNWLQHRVAGVKNISAPGPDPSRDSPATRKILCFFLVDDNEISDASLFPTFTVEGAEDEVFTTSEIASQKRATNVPTLHFLLSIVCQRLTGKNLPRELAEIIVGFGDLGFSRAEAEQYRREVMADRSGDKLNSVGGFSLCEH
ncbi:hypothetical protein C8J56DRAFT_970875, partial [Mycena floridula]